MVEGTELVQWGITQGVAVAVLAFVLVRLEARMTELQRSIDKLSVSVESGNRHREGLG